MNIRSRVHCEVPLPVEREGQRERSLHFTLAAAKMTDKGHEYAASVECEVLGNTEVLRE